MKKIRLSNKLSPDVNEMSNIKAAQVEVLNEYIKVLIYTRDRSTEKIDEINERIRLLNEIIEIVK